MTEGIWIGIALIGVGLLGLLLIEAYFKRKEQFVDHLQSKVEDSKNGTTGQ